MVDARSFQRRFDRSLEDLALTFTDLILLVEALDTRLERSERAHEQLTERVHYLEQQLRVARTPLTPPPPAEEP